ncbi:MAG TPA: non-ribosomal peptide synthetase [Trebonia sp.]|nr:non-ribosomal peptide synthetase [Trebonia sp.]
MAYGSGGTDGTAALADLSFATSAAPAISGIDGDVLSYRDLAGQLQDLHGRLGTWGLGATERVCTVLPDGPVTAIVLLALIQAAVCCPLNPAIGAEEFGSVLDLVRPNAVLLWRDGSPRARAACAARGVPVIELWHDGALSDPIQLRTRDRVAPGNGSGIGESLLLRTSGTTADGKFVPLTSANIIAGGTATGRAYRLEPADRRLNIMPMFHVQGVVGSLIASLLCGSSVLCAAGFTPGSLFDVIERERITWFSASPTMHRRILEQGSRSRRGRGLRFVRCGSGALPDELRARLEDFYQVPLVESYGMTEAHQIASTPVDGGDKQAGMIPTGSRVAIRADDGAVSEVPGMPGEIVVSGRNVIDRYADRDRAQDPAFAGEWFRTGDQGLLTAEGRLLITGRIKDQINRGGEKISPWEVERVLLRHEAVGETLAYPAPHPELMEEVAVAVVLRPGYTVADYELRDFAADVLAPHKVPRYIRFVSALPRSDTGKPSRRLLRHEHVRSSPRPVSAGPGGADAPTSPLQARLVEIWSAALGGRAVGIHDDFYRVLDGDSLAAMALLAMVRETLGAEISHLTFADHASTVGDMADLIGATGRVPLRSSP